MNIHFTPLTEIHFPLLLKWLTTPHIRAWWDKDIHWTNEKITEKYLPYTRKYKILNGDKKPIYPFIILLDEMPVGYIQYYNRYDFAPELGYELVDLPQSLAAIDFYIGEEKYLGKGIGSAALRLFLKEYVLPKFNTCLVDPDNKNKVAIRTYQKAGFHILKKINHPPVTWMVVDQE